MAIAVALVEATRALVRTRHEEREMPRAAAAASAPLRGGEQRRPDAARLRRPSHQEEPEVRGAIERACRDHPREPARGRAADRDEHEISARSASPRSRRAPRAVMPYRRSRGDSASSVASAGRSRAGSALIFIAAAGRARRAARRRGG